MTEAEEDISGHCTFVPDIILARSHLPDPDPNTHSPAMSLSRLLRPSLSQFVPRLSLSTTSNAKAGKVATGLNFTLNDDEKEVREYDQIL